VCLCVRPVSFAQGLSGGGASSNLVAATTATLSALSLQPSGSLPSLPAPSGGLQLPQGLPEGGQVIYDASGAAYYIPPPGTALPLSLIAGASLTGLPSSTGGAKPTFAGAFCGADLA
jgi:hypothetical protein